MDILWLIHWTPLPFVPASLLLGAGSSLLPAARRITGWLKNTAVQKGICALCLSHPLSLSLPLCLSLPLSLNRQSWNLPDTLSAFESSSGNKCIFLLLLKSEKSLILSSYKLLCSIRRTQRTQTAFFFFPICLEELLLSCLKLDGFRGEVLFGLFLIAMLKSFLLML